MKPPPLDEAGRVVPHDHADIGDDWIVIRRIHAGWLKESTDGAIGLSTASFTESSEPPRGMSVDLLNLIEEAGVDAKDFVTAMPNNPHAVSFRVGDLRALGLTVGYHPLEEKPPFPANPFHCEVWGIGNARGPKNELRKIAKWFVEPEPKAG
jgi:hypothetical protein